MQDLEKLEKLSCLTVAEKDRSEFAQSLSNAFDLLNEVKDIPISSEEEDIVRKINEQEVQMLLEQKKYADQMYKKQEMLKREQEREEKEQSSSILLKEGFFHSPQILSS